METTKEMLAKLKLAGLKIKLQVIPSQSGTISGLRMQIENLTSSLEMAKAALATAEQERAAALEQLHGVCSTCATYTPNHNEGPCRFCCYENARIPGTEVNDNWRWNGGKSRGKEIRHEIG